MSDHEFSFFRNVDASESISCWEYTDRPGRISVSHRVHLAVSDDVVGESSMVLSRRMAEWLRDRLTDLLGHDAAYEAWIASREQAYGVGPLDIEDPASRFAHEEPPPATDAEYAERQIERGAP